jgi:hypothetical protein
MNVKIMEREILNPLADTQIDDVKLNPIPRSLSRISLFNNTKPGAETVLATIKDNLGDYDFHDARKPAGAGASPKQIENAADSELSILALGDCGSCTTWIVLDAIKLEKKGVSTISVCSDKFAPFARELARSYGAENLKIVEIKHPIAGQAPEMVKSRVLNIIPQIKELLGV